MKFTLTLFSFVLFLSASAQTPIKAELVNSEMIFQDPPFENCHASSIEELTKGRFMATWFAGPFESSPLVTIWTSILEKGKWSKPRQVADGIINDTLRYSCWNPVLFRAASGRLFLFYKVGSSPRTWWGMMKYSDNDGNSWSKAERLPGNILGPIKNKPVQLKDGSILHPSSTESLDEKTWNIHLEISDSACKNWKYIPINCDSFGVIQPSILSYPDGRLQMVCRSRQNVIVDTWSNDHGLTWSPLHKLPLPNPNAGSDAVTLSNGWQLLVYNPALAGKEWYHGRNKLVVAISKNGMEWSDLITLEDHPKGEFSYPAVIEGPGGLVHITYTYDRKNIKYVELKITGQ